MLFTETVYDDDMKKYNIISISEPLVSGTKSYREKSPDVLKTHADYREYLIKDVPRGKQILRDTEDAADEFNFIHSPGMNSTLLPHFCIFLEICRCKAKSRVENGHHR